MRGFTRASKLWRGIALDISAASERSVGIAEITFFSRILLLTGADRCDAYAVWRAGGTSAKAGSVAARAQPSLESLAGDAGIASTAGLPYHPAFIIRNGVSGERRPSLA